MKQKKKVSNRVSLSNLSEKVRQNSAKIDLLDDRLSKTEHEPANSIESQTMVEDFSMRMSRKRDQIRTKVIHMSRAAGCVVDGMMKARDDLAEALVQASKVVKHGRADVARDIERSMAQSKAALQGGITKAKHDVDKSAKVAMRIVGN